MGRVPCPRSPPGSVACTQTPTHLLRIADQVLALRSREWQHCSSVLYAVCGSVQDVSMRPSARRGTTAAYTARATLEGARKLATIAQLLWKIQTKAPGVVLRRLGCLRRQSTVLAARAGAMAWQAGKQASAQHPFWPIEAARVMTATAFQRATGWTWRRPLHAPTDAAGVSHASLYRTHHSTRRAAGTGSICASLAALSSIIWLTLATVLLLLEQLSTRRAGHWPFLAR